ncbi:MAG: type II secretion system protein [Planctomycetes bacterium]|nr:type II secretion system protein [Planctomycetota bacterium]
MKGKRKRAPGFTMVEVLVVMAILAFLATLSFWGLSEIRQNMRIRQTQELTTRVSSAIKEFHTQYLEWPTQTMLDGLAPPQTWYEFLNRGYTEIKAGTSTLSKYENRGAFLELNDSNLDTAGAIIDVWQQPLVIDVDAVNNRVLVYSLGPDMESDNGLYRGDGNEEAAYTTPEPIDDIPGK